MLAKKRGLFKAPLISLSTGVDMPHTVDTSVSFIFSTSNI